MTQQEFEQRTGIKSDVIYEIANGVYMEAGDMDKDSFCMDYKKHGDSILLGYFYKKCVALRKELRGMKEERQELVEFLLKQEDESDDIIFRNKAAELVGDKEVIRLKIENGWELDKEDKEYIKEHLL